MVADCKPLLFADDDDEDYLNKLTEDSQKIKIKSNLLN
jgi:hypothetical protein